ncbi:hypothetical protein AAEO56_07345 [Flavobacterium sp. DGU11]|uniref:DUF1795 domain-containing protein n=1 Tax=Flavobacterium arundinis TaxID=3139143 RepID=A0ABU9HV82_9FLAO
MKNFIQMLLLLVFATGFAQETSSHIDVDDTVAIEMPGDVYVLDTIQNGMKLLQYRADTNNSIFLIQRVKITQISEPLPKERLISVYKGLLAGHAKTLADNGYEILRTTETEISGQPARRVLYGKNKQPLAEFLFLIKGLFIYTSSYSSEQYFDEKVSTAFLAGIKIKPE